jgi:acyl-CoA synthetase (AMP-forming)/AMP-acid ligase II
MADHNIYSVFRRSARADPDWPAVVFMGRVTTYGELDAEIAKMATRLRALGVERGDRVLMYSPNVPEYYAVNLGCAYAGAIFAPINVAFRVRELAYITQNAKADLAVVHASLYKEFKDLVAGLPDAPRRVVLLGGPSPHADSRVVGAIEDIPADTLEPPFDCDASFPSLICYTSGSTSVPKAVLHSHGSTSYSAMTYAAVWRHRREDSGVVVPPLSWIFGISTTSMGMFAAGSTVILLPRFHPERTLEAIESHRATMFFGTTSMYTKMLDVMRHRDFDLSSLRFCMIGGEPCPESAVRPVEQRIGRRLIQAWALTENHPMVAMDANDVNAPRGTAGRVVPGGKLRILDPSGNEVPDGTPGEACVSGPGAMTGYYREPQLTAERMAPDGSIRTGDLVVRDKDGYVFVVGRVSDMIIRSGANIAPAEVETVLLDFPGIAAACVVGSPDPVSGEAIVAYVVTIAGMSVDREELLAHLQRNLAHFKVPQSIVFRDELPTNTSGKLDRAALKAMAAQDASNTTASATRSV